MESCSRGIGSDARERFYCTAPTVKSYVVEGLWRRSKGYKTMQVLQCVSVTNKEASTDEVFYGQLQEISALVALVLYGSFQLPRHQLEIQHCCDKQIGEKFLKFIKDNLLSRIFSETTKKYAHHNLFVICGNRSIHGRCAGRLAALSAVIKRWLNLKIFLIRGEKDQQSLLSQDLKRANIKLFRQLFNSAFWESVYEGVGIHKY